MFIFTDNTMIIFSTSCVSNEIMKHAYICSIMKILFGNLIKCKMYLQNIPQSFFSLLFCDTVTKRVHSE